MSTVLLLRPDLDVLAGLMLFPDASKFFALGEPSDGPIGAAIVVLQLLNTMAGYERYGAAARAYAKSISPGPVELSSVHADTTTLRVNLEWHGKRRTLVYFFRSIGGDAWPEDIQGVDAVLDFGEGKEALDEFGDLLLERLSGGAVLLASKDVYSRLWKPKFPKMDEAVSSPPLLMDRTWDDGGLWRFDCLRHRLMPEVYGIGQEMREDFLDI